MARKQYPMLDWAKFACSVLILLYHFSSEYVRLPGLLDEALSLYAVAVALFMGISGFLLFDKLQSISTVKERWAVVVRQVKRIMGVYLLWSIPYLIHQIVHWSYGSLTMGFVLGKLQGWVFNTTYATIWFMPALCVGLVIAFWASERLPEPALYALCLVCYLTGSLMLTYKHFGQSIPGFAAFTVFASKWLQGPRGGLFFAFPLLIVGRLAVTHRCRISKPVSLAGCAIVAMAVLLAEALILRRISHDNTGIDLTFTMLPLVWLLLCFLTNGCFAGLRSAKSLRTMSVLIFMSQRLFLSVLPECIPGASELLHQPLEGFVIICGGTVTLSWLIWEVSKSVPCLRKLY